MGRSQPLDFDAFVKFLTAHGHNFTLLVDGGNAEILRPSLTGLLRILRLAPFHGRGQAPARQLTAD